MAHGRGEMTRAVLEGVAYNLRIILDAFRDQGASISALRLIGGGARLPLWRQILADVLQVPILRPTLVVEATSLGAAIAGGVGIGVYPSYGVARDLVQVELGEEPRPDVSQYYDEGYGVFQEAYAALEPVFDRLSAIASFGPTAPLAGDLV